MAAAYMKRGFIDDESQAFLQRSRRFTYSPEYLIFIEPPVCCLSNIGLDSWVAGKGAGYWTDELR